AGSRLYLRLVGDSYGTRMPPDQPLEREEIEVVRAWIDEGAPWPDELSGDLPPAVADPDATSLMELLRRGERRRASRLLRVHSQVVDRRGPGGATPLMYAALYGDAGMVRDLLERGADTDARNEAGATALMWAVPDV